MKPIRWGALCMAVLLCLACLTLPAETAELPAETAELPAEAPAAEVSGEPAEAPEAVCEPPEASGEDHTPADTPEEALPADTAEAESLPAEESEEPAAPEEAERELSVSEEPAADGEGEFGIFEICEGLRAELVDGVLTVRGEGAIPDYTGAAPPWSGVKASVAELAVEAGVTRIGAQAFAGCTSLAHVALADTVISLGDGAFYGCTALTGVELPASVETLGEGCFACCAALSDFSGPGLSRIGSYAFQETALEAFTVPARVTALDAGAFWKTDISAFYTDPENTAFTARDGVLFSKDGTVLALYPRAREDASYAVPAEVSAVADMAFAQALYLEQVDLGSVKTLGASAFQECAALASVTLPDTLETAGPFAFYGCAALRSAGLGNGLGETSFQMFENCASLTEIDFGGVGSLGPRSFAGCAFQALSLPASVETVGNACFAYCRALTAFRSGGLTDIPYQAFYGCGSLSSLTLNEGVERIERAAFSGCGALRETTLPASVRYAASGAFPAGTVLHGGHARLEPFGVNGLCLQERITVAGTFDYSAAFALLELVNEERESMGCEPLVMDRTLLSAAMERAAECSVLFSHTRPNGGGCQTACPVMTGESIAFGQDGPGEVVSAWMESSGHRANILEHSHTAVGAGCFDIDGQRYWTLCFGDAPSSDGCEQPENEEVTRTVALAAEPFPEAADSLGVVWNGRTYAYALRLQGADEPLTAGGTAQLTCFVINPAAGLTPIMAGDLRWTSDDPAAASVENGMITALGAGSVVITAETSNGDYAASLTVTVDNPWGDADGDGGADAWDAVLILQAAAGLREPAGDYGPADAAKILMRSAE